MEDSIDLGPGHQPRYAGMLSDRALLAILGLLFLLSRLVVAYGAGLRFDTTPLGSFWQYLDPQLLDTDLARSLVHLHSQPPLFNLFLGLVLKLSPGAPAGVFHLVYLLAGGLCCGSVFFITRRLGVAKPWAFGVSALLVMRPDFIIFENHLTYDVPVTALLCLAAVWLVLYAGNGRELYAHAFFLTLAAVCASRSLFHPIYLAGVAGMLVAAGVHDKARLARAAALPALLLLALLVKNFMLFGQFSTSTWLGMNLWRIASTELTKDEMADLRQQGALSDVAGIKPFSRPDAYPAHYLALDGVPPVRAVTDQRRSSGAVNYNHAAYIEIARSYLRDSSWVIRHRPGDYLLGIAKAGYYFLTPQTRIQQVRRLRDDLGGYARFSETFLYGKLPWGFHFGTREWPIYLFSTLGVAILFAGSFYFSGRRGGLDAPSRNVMAFLALTMLYVALVGNSLEVLENQRFRFMIDPFLAVVLALVLHRGAGFVSAKIVSAKVRSAP